MGKKYPAMKSVGFFYRKDCKIIIMEQKRFGIKRFSLIEALVIYRLVLHPSAR
jgi:hypothetical protein